ITRNYFAEITRFIHDVPRGFDHRVDHSEYATYIAGGNRGVMNFDANNIRDGIVGRIRFDYNYIHDITPSSADGGSEIIRTGSTSQAIGTSWTVANPFIWIENNLLVNISIPGEGEVFSIKSPGNIIRGNTLINVQMYISLRTTHDTEVSQNWIEGGSGLAINGHGRNNRYIANRVLDGREFRIGAGDATTQDQIDALPASTVFYAAS